MTISAFHGDEVMKIQQMLGFVIEGYVLVLQTKTCKLFWVPAIIFHVGKEISALLRQSDNPFYIK